MLVHSILFVGSAAPASAGAAMSVVRMVREYLLAQRREVSSVALYLGAPLDAQHTKVRIARQKKKKSDPKLQVRRVVKHGVPLADALAALCGPAAAFSPADALCDRIVLSKLLRGLLQDLDGRPASRKRVTVFLCVYPDAASDPDLLASLGAARLQRVDVELVVVACRAGADTSAVLGDLAVCVGGEPHVCLARVCMQSTPDEDFALVRTTWLRWAVPECESVYASLVLARGHAPLRLQVLPLSVASTGAAAAPEPMLQCKCHGLVVARPPRCAVSGRKPTTQAAHGYSLSGGTCVLAADAGPGAAVEYRVVAALPASALDCCVVLGEPRALLEDDSDDASGPQLLALATHLQRSAQCLLLRRTDRFGTTLHLCAAPVPAVPGPMVMVRVAAREEVLRAPPPLPGMAPVDETVVLRTAAALGTVPQLRAYEPLAHSTNWMSQLERAVAAHRDVASASTASAPASSGPAAPAGSAKAPLDE